MIRYYLIPFHPDPASQGYEDGACLKYMDLFANWEARPPEEVVLTRGSRQWAKAFFIVRSPDAEVDLPSDALELSADRITHPAAVNFLKAQGVIVPSKPTAEEVERAVNEWMGNGPKTLAQMFGEA